MDSDVAVYFSAMQPDGSLLARLQKSDQLNVIQNSVTLLEHSSTCFVLPHTDFQHRWLCQLFSLSMLLQLNADIYESDPELEQIRKEQGYSYMDIITIHKDTLPNYEEKVI